MMNRTISEVLEFTTFEDRYNYLKLDGYVGRDTFGYDRYLNQKFYKSVEWQQIRQYVIARDLGCDLAMEGHEIYGMVLIHHMNPINPRDIVHHNKDILDPEYLICVSHKTHNAIHYGDENQLEKPYVPRVPGDTKLW